MLRTLFSATILAGALAGNAMAQAPDAGCVLPSEPKGIPAAIDAAITGPADKDRACMKALLIPEARMMFVSLGAAGAPTYTLQTLDDWIARVKARGHTSDASTSGTPRTFFDPSSTPMTTIPPAAFANATRHFRMPSGDDKSRLNSRVFPSVCFSSSTRTTTPHSARKGFLAARLPSASTGLCQKCAKTHPLDSLWVCF